MDPTRHLRLHRAPPDLLARGVALAQAGRARRPRIGGSAAWRAAALAAVFLLGIGVGLLAARDPRATPTRASLSVASADPSSDLVPVRFVLFAPDASKVNVAGTWNAWDAAATPMRAAGGGVFHAVVPLERGRHEYMFVVDGETWISDPAAPLSRDDGFGRRNAILEI